MNVDPIFGVRWGGYPFHKSVSTRKSDSLSKPTSQTYLKIWIYNSGMCQSHEIPPQMMMKKENVSSQVCSIKACPHPHQIRSRRCPINWISGCEHNLLPHLELTGKYIFLWTDICIFILRPIIYISPFHQIIYRSFLILPIKIKFYIWAGINHFHFYIFSCSSCSISTILFNILWKEYHS